MPDCTELQNLRRAAAEASERYSSLLEERERLRGITGLSDEALLDILFERLAACQTAAAAVIKHVETHCCVQSRGPRCESKLHRTQPGMRTDRFGILGDENPIRLCSPPSISDFFLRALDSARPSAPDVHSPRLSRKESENLLR